MDPDPGGLAGKSLPFRKTCPAWRKPVLVVSFAIPGLAILFAVFQTTFWSYMPQWCPLARNLPVGAVAIKCDYSSDLDFEIEFEAKISRSGMQDFIASLSKALRDPHQQWKGDDRLRIRTSDDAVVDIGWQNGVMSVDYNKY